ncbi:MAG: bifunctional oligoribonuclease/PAP phosphatase NrnA [Kiritimatiellaeota bacterium]|nr:bifunctional oligoribonuclease/PAP phosphatase NrnA [Kiritimatiellota bacterium]
MRNPSTGRLRGLNAVAEAVKGPGKFLVTGHLRPDGDALGSALALSRLLNQSGKKAFFTAFKSQLGRPGFLEGCARVVRPEDAVKKRYDAWITLDCGTVERLPEPLQPHAAHVRVINIDHHATNTLFGETNWIDPAASCTGEMVWRLARRMKWPLDRACAEALWVALVTDTGRFAHEHTRPAALRFGADLLRRGVRTAPIDDRIYTFVNANTMALKQRAYASLENWFDGRVAVISLTREDFRETRTAKADAEDFTEIPRSLAPARVALFFYQNERLRDNTTYLSIRTRPPLDATLLAVRFNGGGHIRAAGCNLEMPIPDAMRAVREALAECYDLGGGAAP